MIIDHEIKVPYECRSCRHFLGNARCLAFDTIPIDIYIHAESHITKIKGQQGDYVFTPVKTAETIRVYENQD